MVRASPLLQWDNTMCELKKRSKKAQKEYYSKRRVVNGFNTGTRDMQTEKHKSRAKRKEEDRKEVEDV